MRQHVLAVGADRSRSVVVERAKTGEEGVLLQLAAPQAGGAPTGPNSAPLCKNRPSHGAVKRRCHGPCFVWLLAHKQGGP